MATLLAKGQLGEAAGSSASSSGSAGMCATLGQARLAPPDNVSTVSTSASSSTHAPSHSVVYRGPQLARPCLASDAVALLASASVAPRVNLASLPGMAPGSAPAGMQVLLQAVQPLPAPEVYALVAQMHVSVALINWVWRAEGRGWGWLCCRGHAVMVMLSWWRRHTQVGCL